MARYIARSDRPPMPSYKPALRGRASDAVRLSQVVSFLLSILSLYWVTIGAFFVPGSQWQDRLTLALLRLGVSACVFLRRIALLLAGPRAA